VSEACKLRVSEELPTRHAQFRRFAGDELWFEAACDWWTYWVVGGPVMKILLADDDEISRILLQFQLEEWGHSVVPAENGLQAWELLQTAECQVVITDWMMPEMSGIELLRKIRSSDFGGYVYVILLTSKSDKKSFFNLIS
jgi:CheY-like chemotaxis protein